MVNDMKSTLRGIARSFGLGAALLGLEACFYQPPPPPVAYAPQPGYYAAPAPGYYAAPGYAYPPAVGAVNLGFGFGGGYWGGGRGYWGGGRGWR